MILSFLPLAFLRWIVNSSKLTSFTFKLTTSLILNPAPQAKEIISLCFGFLITSMMFLIFSLERTIGSFLLRLANFKFIFSGIFNTSR
ncbi:MAG: hypothetical protein A2746_00125 [Candidatus Yanofskybacteria bacterium RIFCSPHIGHO2_01_FULL_44_22]|uniref:Uncharacterized protein n=1 Tax=Candidatus Yanofskybacteria bacterium RIFCSPHIGHO2_01_FULL_44_22 TaxID=1802669 RepID=A0A1F8EYP0_9BACT|nr:MAG: hypothetical protein A2746_00125 [Candidatus Yanofskybacteria bacterium RIFCSPHIGHO2_01_FULL_44_22]